MMASITFWKGVGRVFSYVEKGKGRSSSPHASPGLACGEGIEVGAGVVVGWALSPCSASLLPQRVIPKVPS